MTNRIDSKFKDARATGSTVLAPFVTVGYPDVVTSEEIAVALLESGGDMLELGIPFSDPLADGATIQKTSLQALAGGVNISTCLEVVRSLRDRGVDSPLVAMGYFNPFMRYGQSRFVADAAEAGVDGLIVPDLPLEEGTDFSNICDGHGLYLIPMLAPTSTDLRIALTCKGARGFIYCVSLTGVTGARSGLRLEAAAGLVERIRGHTDLPVLVGFGVSTREHVEAIGRFADGAVVASAMLDVIDEAPPDMAVQTARDFVTGLKAPSV